MRGFWAFLLVLGPLPWRFDAKSIRKVVVWRDWQGQRVLWDLGTVEAGNAGQGTVWSLGQRPGRKETQAPSG